MHIDPASGLLHGVHYFPSPNCNARAAGVGVEALIIHCISLPPGEFGGDAIHRLFCNRLAADEHETYLDVATLQVSAHFLITRDGTVTQFVPISQCAWHAGQSQCLGRACVNEFSIGVELEGTDATSFEDAQYKTLAKLTRALFKVCPALTPSNIFGHDEIARPLGRKSDPGAHFNWPRYRALIVDGTAR